MFHWWFLLVSINKTPLYILATDLFDVLAVANIFQTNLLEALPLGITRFINKVDTDPRYSSGSGVYFQKGGRIWLNIFKPPNFENTSLKDFGTLFWIYLAK